MTTSKDKSIEVLGQERRRRWSVEEKLAMVRESLEPGQSVSVVARRNGINPNQLFHWRKLYQDGSLSAVSAGEAVVPASELADALKQIRELQRMAVPYRKQGLAKALLTSSLEEFSGLLAKELAEPGFYVEAVVGVDNEPSKRVAGQFFTEPKETVDGVSGLPALHYIKLVE